MSGVLHPVGPEPERTYWLRRATLLVVLALLVALLIGVAGAFGRGPSATAEPPAFTPSPTPSESATDTPAPTSTPTVTSTASPSGSPTSGGSSATPPAKSAGPSSSTSASSESKVKLPTAAPAPAACDAKQLRPTLMGDKSLKVDQNTTFSVSLINGGATTCTLQIAPSTFELKIYSGTDRIWSTNDCTKTIAARSVTLAPEKAVAWRQTWNGQRSRPKCGTASRSTLPRAGVYWATAQFRGAKPVQLRMTIR